ncbi:uncharacterized protein LOC141595442 [Silene latifolia]|uniref:uncharacterized protein LOC141595442 n=1 Tax=Silene latifolia TaxID=37657 RepID=UPI003D76C13A
METRVRSYSINKVHKGLGNKWFLITNNSTYQGGRIWILWDDDVYQVELLNYEAQVVRTIINYRPNGETWLMSFVYDFNRSGDREPLWESLEHFHSRVDGHWLVCGDFNNVIGYTERIGSVVTETEIKMFIECADQCELADIPANGAFFTWCNKQDGDGKRFNRIDRALVNLEWLLVFLDMTTTFLPEGLFDHNPYVMHLWRHTERQRVVFNTSICGVRMKTSCILWSKYGARVFMGTNKHVTRVHFSTIRRGRVLNEQRRQKLMQPVTDLEIREALFFIPAHKPPGPDGYTSQLFKDSFDVIGHVNSTVLTLIPQKNRHVSVADFRPIACCNVLYKCITKVICNRMAEALADIISENQSAFIKGRDIVDNIFICQDLVRLYNRKACSLRTIMKVDLRKAYDSLDWSFIEDMFRALGFPDKLVNRIMVCVTTPTFTLALNGSQFGYFEGKRGIRQGDPMSPLLFTIRIEYFTGVLDVVVQTWDFTFHPLCRSLKLCHMCFADDVFCR